tara:strand:+ start:2795 stop:3535 length:741 start_codon:yes stop_codon:yes gene_type:complete
MKQELTKIVLVEPMGALNLGSIARLCENFGINELRLVSPRCSKNDPEAIRMAVKGKELLNQAKTYTSVLEAIGDCPRVLATCGRLDHGEIPLCPPHEGLEWLTSNPSEVPSAIIFGREDCGLTNQELLLANKVISLQTSPNYPSLNLSHAVAIILHELNKFNFDNLRKRNSNSYNLALPKELDNFLEDAKILLLKTGFLLEHTSEARISKLRGLLHRAEVRSEEVALLRGIIRQIKWAINNIEKIE